MEARHDDKCGCLDPDSMSTPVHRLGRGVPQTYTDPLRGVETQLHLYTGVVMQLLRKSTAAALITQAIVFFGSRAVHSSTQSDLTSSICLGDNYVLSARDVVSSLL